jgi:hypothetical protein
MTLTDLGAHLVLALVVLAGGETSPEGGDAIVCPSQIRVEETPVGLSPEVKWESGSVEHRLVGVDVFEQEKGGRAVLAPAQEERDAEVISLWRLPEGGAYGVICAYEKTAVTLVKPLPARVNECRARLSQRRSVGGLPEVLGFSCGRAQSGTREKPRRP